MQSKINFSFKHIQYYLFKILYNFAIVIYDYSSLTELFIWQNRDFQINVQSRKLHSYMYTYNAYFYAYHVDECRGWRCGKSNGVIRGSAFGDRRADNYASQARGMT